jgi:RecJ-like exonuclease
VTATPFPCKACGGVVAFQRCDEVHGTGHPWLVAMECQGCHDHYEATCPQCQRDAERN